MSETFEQEEVLRSYDSAIMRRMLLYLRPHLPVFLLSMGVLLLAVIGELVQPVLIRRAVDRYIMPYYRAVELDSAPAEVLKILDDGETGHTAADLYFFPASRLSELSGAHKAEMRAKGALLPENFLLIETSAEDTIQEKILLDHSGLFIFGDIYAFITDSDLKSLSIEEQRAVRTGHTLGLSRLVWTVLIVLLGVFICTFSQVYLQTYVGQQIMKDMRTELFEHTLRFPLKYLDANPVGKLVTRVTNDVETVNELFTTVLPSLLRDFALMIGVMIALFLLSPRLALITVITLPPVFILTAFFRSKARNAFRRIREAVSRMNGFLSEHISGMRIVQLFVKEKRIRSEFRRNNRRLLKANFGEMYIFATFRPLVDLLSTVSIAVILYFGAGQLLRDIVTLGILIAFLNLISRFYEPVRDISEKYNLLQSAMAGGERVFALLDDDSRVSQPSNPVRLDSVKGRIEFDRVTFSYKEGETVLDNLSFTVEPGETAAVVGFTGAGKTTIASLLTRLWDIQSGTIRLDGVDIRDIPTDALRRHVQSVLQDVFLFSDTIEDNIRLGSDISNERIDQAVRNVRADSFIDRLPDGKKTVLTERGSNLSVGQRQLISFARVLAHDPDVLILDEATGNIDTETERLIQEALKKLLKGRTSLVIAHRLSTIKNADRILVLHRGKLAESGTHGELLEKRGMYHQLYQMQFLEEQRV